MSISPLIKYNKKLRRALMIKKMDYLFEGNSTKLIKQIKEYDIKEDLELGDQYVGK